MSSAEQRSREAALCSALLITNKKGKKEKREKGEEGQRGNGGQV
jgi:hypothetical protein